MFTHTELPSICLVAVFFTSAAALFGQACPVGTTDSIVTTTAPAEVANFPIKSTNVAAQTFMTPGSTSNCFKLAAMSFAVQRNDNPGDLTVTIYSVDSMALPASAVPNASAVVPASMVSTSLTDQSVTFSNPPSLVGGTMYAVVFSSGPTTGSNDYKLGIIESEGGGAYAGGVYMKVDQSALWDAPKGRRLDVRMSLCFTPCSAGCTLTQGYWKNHAEKWPVTALTLGTATYSQEQLLAILRQEPVGNGLLILAHQLIAAKLNIENNADAGTISATISAADGLIGASVIPPAGTGFLAPSETAILSAMLDAYNSGVIGPGHCAE